MQFIASEKPDNMSSVGVLGYQIVSNKQIHSYQLAVLEEYLGSMGYTISDTVLGDILDGKDSAISYDIALSAFENENESVKRDLYYILIILTLVDDSIDADEEKVITDILQHSNIEGECADEIRKKAVDAALEVRNSRNKLFIRTRKPKPQKLNWFQRIIQGITDFFRSLFGKGQKTEEELEEIEYRSAIERCSITAGEDFASLGPVYFSMIESCTDTLNEIKDYRKSFSLEAEFSAEIAEVIGKFTDILNDDVLVQCKQAQESLNQKKRTVSDFTISLLGRTKAGKSTLHAVLTGQGKDKIGEGKQRTTRYNRVYQWNLLRLIDTPGIGSAEADGRSDDEIAESVLGESDIICFVVVDDSILKDILEFIEKIAELNKPIIILLNHKENIRPDVKYRRFKEHSKEWIETEGEANLAGHINRIQKFADDRGFGSLIKVYPVFLLPALMSSEPEYEEDSELLWQSSNVECFIEQLKNWIIECGTIKRSQTILDEAIQVFIRSQKSICEAEEFLEEQRQKLKQQKIYKVATLKETEKTVCRNVKNLLVEKFDKLAKQDARLFAEEVYDKKENYSELWARYIEKIGFEEEVTEAVKQEVKVYYDKAEDIISSLFEDLYYSAKASIDVHNLNIPILFDFKNACKILGGIVGVAGAILLAAQVISGPVVWIISAVGLALGAGSNLFASKEKKRQNAIDKVYEAVKKSVEDNSRQAIRKTFKEIQKGLADNTRDIETMLEDLEDGLDKVRLLADSLKQEYEWQINSLNILYAYRLVQFINDKNHVEDPFDVSDILSVDRQQPGKIIITTTDAVVPVDGYLLEGIITEKIFIERSVKS